MSYPISQIEGIGEVYAEKLKAAGVNTVEALLEKCATAKGRKSLEKETGIGHKLILKWTNHADLMRINGIAGQFAEILEAAGVDTVKELATRNAENLAAKVAEVNEQKNLVNRVPVASEISRMIEEAKTLPAVVEYKSKKQVVESVDNDDNTSTGNKVRVTLTHRGVCIVELFPVCNQSSREVVENASDKEEAFTNQETYLMEGHNMEFIFGNDDYSVDLSVSEWYDDGGGKGEELMSIEDYELSKYELEEYMSESELNLDQEEYGQCLYASLNDGLKAVVEKRVKPEGFILEAMRQGLVRASAYYTMSDEYEKKKKPHYGVVRGDKMEDEDFTISYTIELEDGEEFDPDLLSFITISTDSKAISPVINEMTSMGVCLLNVALYKGKAYFAGHDDYLEDGGWVSAEVSDFDIINMDLSTKE